MIWNSVVGALKHLSFLSAPTGPILSKELAVSSRRRRNYLLRAAYILGLTIFVALIWVQAVHVRGYRSPAYAIARMSEAGRTIVVCIVWFQFCVVQFLAIVMLSTSISEEISQRTLGVLMTTPINGVQIVLGKLMSKLQQLLVLLAISLPLLAIVRVFGGVPWSFVLVGLGLTLVAAIHAGAWSMLFSIFSRRGYAAILGALFVLGMLYFLLPWFVYEILDEIFVSMSETDFLLPLAVVNPPTAMALLTEGFMRPRMAARYGFNMTAHCATMMGISAALLGVCAMVVRRAGLHQATGAPGAVRLRWWRRRSATHRKMRAPRPRRIRRIKGCPVLWRELRSGVFWRGRVMKICVVLGVLGLLVSYLLCAAENDLDDDDVQIAYVLILMGLGVMAVIVLSASALTSEKEARTFPLLVATPLSDWRIILAKGAGVIRKTWLLWAVLGVHLVCFHIAGILRGGEVFPFVAMAAAGPAVLFTGAGLYFSARFRRSTTAVVMTLALAIFIYMLVPVVGVLVYEITDVRDIKDVVEWTVNFSPLVQVIVAVEHACASPQSLLYRGGDQYDWPSGTLSLTETVALILVGMLGHFAVGGAFLWRAKGRLRKRVF